MERVDVCLTFDVDFVRHAEGSDSIDELEAAFPMIWPLFLEHPQWTATWFIRLDAQMEQVYGAADHVFREHSEIIATMRAAGHEFAWHPHPYKRSGGEWIQNADPFAVAAELAQFAPIARNRGLKTVRMGWGFHSNHTVHVLSDLGFAVDSSAIPRPNYRWETGIRDWNGSPTAPYFPSIADYRRPGSPAVGILEVPISTELVSAPYDQETVIRYLNPAYHPPCLRPGLRRWLDRSGHLVTITHPYELLPRALRHGLLAFDPSAFWENVLAIQQIAGERGRQVSFLTLSQFANQHLEPTR